MAKQNSITCSSFQNSKFWNVQLQLKRLAPGNQTPSSAGIFDSAFPISGFLFTPNIFITHRWQNGYDH